jgi:hypothetical protein
MTKKKEKPEAEIDWDAEMRNAIPVIISQEIRDDVDYQTDEEVTEFYRGLTKMQRAAVDCMLIRICGWSMDAITRAVEKKVPVDEVETNPGYNPFFVLAGLPRSPKKKK